MKVGESITEKISQKMGKLLDAAISLSVWKGCKYPMTSSVFFNCQDKVNDSLRDITGLKWK